MNSTPSQEDMIRKAGGQGKSANTIGIPKQAVFTLKEAAMIFKVHVRTVERWIDQQRLTAIVLPGGKSLRIPYQEMVKAFSHTTTFDDPLQ